MLFLFVLMLVGVDASDSVVEMIKGQRLMATVVGLLFGAVPVVGVAQVTVGAVTGLDEANAEGNVPAPCSCCSPPTSSPSRRPARR